MLECNISHSVEHKNILHDINISLKSSEHLLVLGESGAGKTTLFSILAGLQQPSHGNVAYEGQDIYTLSAKKRDAFRGKNIGIIFQELHLIPVLTVKENLQMTQSLVLGAKDEALINTTLEQLNLANKANQRTQNLSVGERQRLAIARALINKPKWIFADEPTSALDDKNTQATLALLKTCAKNIGASLVIATHDKRVKDAFTKERIMTLDGGKIA